jgi:hypothetical protein
LSRTDKLQVGLEVLNQFLPEEIPETDDYSTSEASERMPKEPSTSSYSELVSSLKSTPAIKYLVQRTLE